MAKAATSSRTTAPIDPAQGLQRPATRDRLRKKGPAVEDVEVCVDGELAADWEQLEAQISLTVEAGAHRNLDGGKSDDYAELERKIEAMRPALEEATITMRLRSLGRKAHDELRDLHPPTDEQIAEHRKETAAQLIRAGKITDDSEVDRFFVPPDYNPDTFPPALIAACCIVPGDLTEEDVVEFGDTWNENEYLTLWMAAVRVHSKSRVGHWGKATG